MRLQHDNNVTSEIPVHASVLLQVQRGVNIGRTQEDIKCLPV
jgi:type III secretory pathway lipoprotein EscJ